MQAFRALLWKEWRDARVAALCAFAILPAASVTVCVIFAISWSGEVDAAYLGEFSTRVVVPALTGLVAAAIAAGAFRTDTQADLDALALLPTPLVLPWLAKVSMLLVASALAYGWSVACMGTAWQLFRGPEPVVVLLEGLSTSVAPTSLAACVAFATLYFATQRAPGLAAVACASAAGVVVHVFATGVRWSWLVGIDGGDWLLVTSSLVMAVAFAGGSVIAFVQGVHLAPRFRTTVSAAAPPVGVAAVVVVGLAVYLPPHHALDPGDADAVFGWSEPSASRSHLALNVHKRDARYVERVWLLDLADGSIRQFAADTFFWRVDRSLLLTPHAPRWPWEGDTPDLVVDVESRNAPRPSVADDWQPWGPDHRADPEWVVIERSRLPNQGDWKPYRVRTRWPARGIERTIESRTLRWRVPYAAAYEGTVVFTRNDAQLVRLDLESGAETVLLDEDVPWMLLLSVSSNGKRALVQGGREGRRVVDIRTGAELFQDDVDSWGFIPGRDDVLRISARGGHRLYHIERDIEVAIRTWDAWWLPDDRILEVMDDAIVLSDLAGREVSRTPLAPDEEVYWLDGDQVLRVERDPATVRITTLDGRLVRRLYPQPEGK